MNRILRYVPLLPILLAFVACAAGGQGTTIVGNTTSSSITVGKLAGDEATVTIPLSVFETTPTISAEATGRFLTGSSSASASSSSLSGATIDIEINGVTTNEGVSAEDNYDESSESVIFTLSSLEDGDQITFIIHKNDGTTASFSGTVSASEETTAASDSGSVDGTTALAERDLSAAVSAYCDAYDGGDTDSSVAFGCYLAKALSLPETSDFAAILDDFGEDHVDVENDILGDIVDGFTGEDDASSAGFNYLNYENLPFNSFLSGNGALGEKLAQFAVGLNASGTTVEVLQSDIDALYGDFEELEELLDVVMADADFVFDIPAGLFGTAENLEVSYDQIHLHMGVVQATLVSLDILAAYDFGVTAADVVNGEDSDFDYEVLTADLNGTGETVNGVTVDATPFLTLVDGARITGASGRAAEALQHLSEGLQVFDEGETAEFWNAAEHISASEARESLDDLLTSLNDDVAVELGEIEGRTVNVNLHEFFANPPSATDVDSTDPFVFEDGTILIVESYFQDLLDGIAEF